MEFKVIRIPAEDPEAVRERDNARWGMADRPIPTYPKDPEPDDDTD